MLSFGVELSFREEPHTQLVTFNGFTDQEKNGTIVSYRKLSNEDATLSIKAQYVRHLRAHYQVKWWVMVPFSEDVKVNGELVDVYINAAADEAGLKYGKGWTRVKLIKGIKNGTIVRVGPITFTLEAGDIRDLMIYRRLDNHLIELEWLWWNVDRHGPLPAKWYHSCVAVHVDGGFPEPPERSLSQRVVGRARRTIRDTGKLIYRIVNWHIHAIACGKGLWAELNILIVLIIGLIYLILFHRKQRMVPFTVEGKV